MSDPPPNPRPVIAVFKDRYELLEFIDEGGMGRIYRAYDKTLGRDVAVKILTQTDSHQTLERFHREARILSRLSHPNLIPIYDFGVEGAEPFMVMELLEGKSLDVIIAESGPPPLSIGLNWIRQIGEALAAVHDEKIVHRDIKPQNIILTRRGARDWLYLLDFGLAVGDVQIQDGARLTGSGYAVGTQRYMAPEQMEGHPASTACDIFSFGLVCAEILGGARTVTAGRINRDYLPPSPIEPYWPIIQRACEDQPVKRWPSIRSFLHALDEPHKKSWRWLAPLQRPGTIAAWISGLFLIVAVGLAILKGKPGGTAPIPIVAIEQIQLNWKNSDELEVRIRGHVRNTDGRRLFLETALCDQEGNRIPSKDSPLADRALGALQALDILEAPQTFEKHALIAIDPALQDKSYATVTIIDKDNRILTQSFSAYWSDRPAESSHVIH